jgi:hypothetical protein
MGGPPVGGGVGRGGRNFLQNVTKGLGLGPILRIMI